MTFHSKVPYTWIVVFLGNPGPKYEMTRHNTGFMVCGKYEKLHDVKVNRAGFHALTGTGSAGEEKLLLMKPQTFMNASGTAVSEAMEYYGIPLDHVLVISDDVTLPVGKIRIRRSGSAGGHNGLKDIIAKCGGEGFPRIKVGVGIPEYDLIDWVLSGFSEEDIEEMDKSTSRAAEAVGTVITSGIEISQNMYN